MKLATLLSLYMSALIFHCFLFLALSFSSPIWSDEEHLFSIAELVNIALSDHPTTKLAWWRAKESAAALGLANSSYYPRLAFQADAKHGRDFKFLNGPDTNYTLLGGNLTLSFLLWDFGGRDAATEAARYALEAANWQSDWAMQQVMLKAIENGYGVLQAQEAVEVAWISMKDAELILEIAETMRQSGLQPISDLYTSQAILAEMRIAWHQQMGFLKIQRAQLAVSLGRSPEEIYHLAPIETLPEVNTETVQELTARALLQRADWLAKAAFIGEVHALNKQVRTQNFPKISFSAMGGGQHAFHDKANGAQYQIGLNLQFPIFQGFENLYKRDQAAIKIRLSEEAAEEFRLDLSLEIMRWLNSFETAQEVYANAKELLGFSQKAFDATCEKYKAGVERMSEFSAAHKRLAEARLRHMRVKTEWLNAAVHLAYVTGSLSTQFVEAEKASCKS